MGLGAGRIGRLRGAKSGQYLVSVVWLAARVVLRRFVCLRRARMLRWRICDLVWAGSKEVGLWLDTAGVVGTGVRSGLDYPSGVVGVGCVSGRMCGFMGWAAFLVSFAFLSGRVGSGERSLGGGVGVSTRVGSQSLSLWSAAAAVMLCVWGSHESV